MEIVEPLYLEVMLAVNNFSGISEEAYCKLEDRGYRLIQMEPSGVDGITILSFLGTTPFPPKDTISIKKAAESISKDIPGVWKVTAVHKREVEHV